MKYQDLTSIIKGAVFSRNDLALAGFKVHDYQLSLWVKKGYLVRLKNGLYAFRREMEKLRREEIAFLLCQPSYLRLESALAWYGFIPEIVYAFTSVTSRVTRTFENPLGSFIYRHVKSELLWGYVEMKTEHGQYLLAEPEKALLDYFYLNLGRINSAADFESIRLNQAEIANSLDREKFLVYLEVFGVKKMERWARQCLP
jgi:hypothetical protein